MSYLFKCKFCTKEIVNDYIDKRKLPVFDNIYHKKCYEIIQGKNKK